MKNIALFLLILLISNNAFLQSYPQINVKPIKPKGKALVYYSVKQDYVWSNIEKEPLFTYFPNSKLIDWRNSI
ncbi:MAG: hypothetical protein EBS86_15545, partial [Crocinitomicaceae bacterium]|nr:hypothetical protein [Crocinitomicaceae bacterium]